MKKKFDAEKLMLNNVPVDVDEKVHLNSLPESILKHFFAFSCKLDKSSHFFLLLSRKKEQVVHMHKNDISRD